VKLAQEHCGLRQLIIDQQLMALDHVLDDAYSIPPPVLGNVGSQSSAVTIHDPFMGFIGDETGFDDMMFLTRGV